jgi:hypothetical protein
MPRGPPAPGRLQRPEPLGRIPPQLLDIAIENEPAAQVELVGDALEVGVQLGLHHWPSNPACCSRTAVAIPPKPVPMIATWL